MGRIYLEVNETNFLFQYINNSRARDTLTCALRTAALGFIGHWLRSSHSEGASLLYAAHNTKYYRLVGEGDAQACCCVGHCP